MSYPLLEYTAGSWECLPTCTCAISACRDCRGRQLACRVAGNGKADRLAEVMAHPKYNRALLCLPNELVNGGLQGGQGQRLLNFLFRVTEVCEIKVHGLKFPVQDREYHPCSSPCCPQLDQ